jgi:hypothetical protein
MKSLFDLLLDEMPPDKQEQSKRWMRIQKELTKVHDEEAENRKRFNAEQKILDDRRTAARKQCKHEKVTQQTTRDKVDGGSETHTECDICGVVLP